jgi:hypothetical protein
MTLIQILGILLGQLEGLYYSLIDSIIKGECSVINSINTINIFKTLKS